MRPKHSGLVSTARPHTLFCMNGVQGEHGMNMHVSGTHGALLCMCCMHACVMACVPLHSPLLLCCTVVASTACLRRPVAAWENSGRFCGRFCGRQGWASTPVRNTLCFSPGHPLPWLSQHTVGRLGVVGRHVPPRHASKGRVHSCVELPSLWARCWHGSVQDLQPWLRRQHSGFCCGSNNICMRQARVHAR